MTSISKNQSNPHPRSSPPPGAVIIAAVLGMAIGPSEAKTDTLAPMPFPPAHITGESAVPRWSAPSPTRPPSPAGSAPFRLAQDDAWAVQRARSLALVSAAAA